MSRGGTTNPVAEGAVISLPKGGGGERYRFAGKERDEESGRSFFGARYYLSWLASFGSVDPHGMDRPGWSPYCYVLDNPIGLTDPTGLDPVKALATLDVNVTVMEARERVFQQIVRMEPETRDFVLRATCTSGGPGCHQ